MTAPSMSAELVRCPRSARSAPPLLAGRGMRAVTAAGHGEAMKPTQALHEAGQSLWLDNITRALLDEGILARYVDEYSVTGLTSNPAVFDWVSLEMSPLLAYDTAALDKLQRQGAEAFAASWQDLLARIGSRHEQLSR
jgi:hypothetical protein